MAADQFMDRSVFDSAAGNAARTAAADEVAAAK